jgi:uncharacterized repeat protein (TIGR03806 family)
MIPRTKNSLRQGLGILQRWPGILTLVSLALFQPLSSPAHAQLVRQPNNTLHFPPQPISATGDPVLTEAFPGLQFDKPICIRSAPGDTNHLYVAERTGRILVVDLDNPVPRVFLDIRDRVTASDWVTSVRAEGLTSFEFHPDFQNNGRFFVTYTLSTNSSGETLYYNRLSEFEASSDRSSGLPESEIPYITQFDEGDGHNINDAHFGPDGYLYVAIGDEGDGGTGDDFNNAQKIDKDFFSAIMRIDVDKRPGNLPPNPHPANTDNYYVPADNPFVGATSFLGKTVDPTKIHDEFWAVGFRNAWRISFDPLTGELYEGDVGQHTREEINRIEKGGNYGWSFKEGTAQGPKGPAPDGFTFIDPIWEYGLPPGEFQQCVTGGVVYRGSRLPQFYGCLIFADFQNGNVWAMNVDQNPPAEPVRLLRQTGICSFGYDPRNGDVLAVNHNEGKIMRLDVSGGTGGSYPATLADTGIFSDLASLTPNSGIVSYDVNLPFWSDGALKRRWFTVPDVSQKIQFSPAGNWVFPAGGVWIKHFDLQTRAGDPSSIRRVETRALIKTPTGMYGLTYKWDDSGSNASLVPDAGDSEDFTITENGQQRQQTWKFPSRADCLSCHTAQAGYVLGFTTAQLNRPETYGSITTNQIAALSAAGYLNNPPANTKALPALPQLDDESVSRTWRVKAYLAANCSQCHQQGLVHAQWDARLSTPLSSANIVNGALFNNLGDSANRVVVPGSLDHSAMLQRISENGANRMPPIASTVLDQQAIQLLTAWITQDLSSYESYEDWAARTLSGSDGNRGSDPDNDGIQNYAEYLLGTDPRSSASKFPLGISITNNQLKLSYTQPANRSLLIETADNPASAAWSPLNDPANGITFPAQPVSKSIQNLLNGKSHFYRFRITEP